MRLAFVADGHSSIARSWIDHFLAAGHEVHLISSYPCEGDPRLASLTIVPLAFSGATATGGRGGRLAWLRTAGGQRARVPLRQWLGPLTLPGAARRIHYRLQEIQPDLVHAMRIPFEGMAAALAQPAAPLVLSTWGNDFTLHARATPFMALATRRAVRLADALHADCDRDVRAAQAWGLGRDRPTVVLPGNGGVRTEIFHPRGEAVEAVPQRLAGHLKAVAGTRWIANARGFRVYVRHDTFFRSVPEVVSHCPEVRFLCPAMAGEEVAHRWVRALGLEESVMLLPHLEPEELAYVFRNAAAAVSLGTHDGTPNTLLEAMACGCLPVVGDLESIREWIRDGENGLLVDAANPADVAAAIRRAVTDDRLRRDAAGMNAGKIAHRARYEDVMHQAERFYAEVVERRGARNVRGPIGIQTRRS